MSQRKRGSKRARGPSGSRDLNDVPTADLVRDAQQGDEASFDALCSRYRPDVYRFLLARFGDPYDADDIAQEAFERVRRYLGSYIPQDETPWRAWLFVVVRNVAADAVVRRRNSPDPMDPFTLDLRRELLGAALPPPTGPGWIDDERVLAAFSALSEDQQHVLALRLHFDLSVAETAPRLGRPQSYVGVLYSRALARLRDNLGGRGSGNPPGDHSYARRRAELSPTLDRRRWALAGNA